MRMNADIFEKSRRKKRFSAATHNRYFAEFVKLVASVDQALMVLATQANEILRLMGVYTKHLAGYVTA